MSSHQPGHDEQQPDNHHRHDHRIAALHVHGSPTSGASSQPTTAAWAVSSPSSPFGPAHYPARAAYLGVRADNVSDEGQAIDMVAHMVEQFGTIDVMASPWIRQATR
jgi:hypothetical protein